MERDRRNPYAPSAPDGTDGSYARPPGKFALTDALGSAGKSNVVPPRPRAAGGADKPEPPDDSPIESVGLDTDTVAKEAAPAREAAAPEQATPAVGPTAGVPAQKLPRLDLGRRGDEG